MRSMERGGDVFESRNADGPRDIEAELCFVLQLPDALNTQNGLKSQGGGIIAFIPCNCGLVICPALHWAKEQVHVVFAFDRIRLIKTDPDASCRAWRCYLTVKICGLFRRRHALVHFRIRNCAAASAPGESGDDDCRYPRSMKAKHNLSKTKRREGFRVSRQIDSMTKGRSRINHSRL